MVNLPTINNINCTDKKILVRADFNVEDEDNPRVESIRKLILLLREKAAAKVKVISHTETKYNLASELSAEFPVVEFDMDLRNNPGEKENNLDFARQLADGWDVYINEAFSVSHREHASIVSLPKVIKENGGEVCLGLRFEKEIVSLSRVLNDQKRPLVMVISGIKEDKLPYVESFTKFADKILIGGRLSDYREKAGVEFAEKIIWADLIADKEDITIHSVEKFEEEIKTAGTIVVSGPIGKFEEEGHRQGTKRVFNAVVSNQNAYKVAGGGDTEAAISLLGFGNGFDWISVGGGAMLEFLANRTLPGIKALVE
ncbi:MAG: Phosphoglycerate kinase [Candidatus Curtissbacteria bacterium GW2011_GWA1_40_16]|uniref:phosphoglycerate kinase n=1 Tax=Candidatus Curtissbacteria bacterium GW2011_GWA1_40_16 TaxID=1618405 RepID=A0A0G0RJ04_9BACT|nr:MAG: Phosphoglycerate kinase [Candidatus Curtissbacteria bacterium GW2011_GWA1_40_16]